jgi:hypothetical protein
MKIVINTCFGGFGLSSAGIRAYLARKGKQAYFYENPRYSGGIDFKTWVLVSEPGPSWFTTFTKDHGLLLRDEQAQEALSDGSYFSYNDIDRNDPDLVAVVEELGEKAAGRYAALSVVEVPDDADWYIAEYDGSEHVAEKHRTWS